MREKRTPLQSMLGNKVTIHIDRPLGSTHPQHPSLVYPINYGFLPDQIGGDGMPQDAYLLGVDTPVSEFTGIVIGIVRRLNDREDKLVVAPEGMHFHQAQIADAVRFQEQYFATRIVPLYHQSCGAIIYKKMRHSIRYLVIFQRGSHTWSFPKGHMELDETEEITACREIREEVGLSVRLQEGFRRTATYPVGNGEKTVVLFLAQSPDTPVIRSVEALVSRWVTLQEAQKLLHASLYSVLEEAEFHLTHRNS